MLVYYWVLRGLLAIFTITVLIPIVLWFKGVDSGDTIRVPGAGNGGGKIQPGSLFIKLKVHFLAIFYIRFLRSQGITNFRS